MPMVLRGELGAVDDGVKTLGEVVRVVAGSASGFGVLGSLGGGEPGARPEVSGEHGSLI